MKRGPLLVIAVAVAVSAAGAWFALFRPGASASKGTPGAEVEPESAFRSELKPGDEVFAVESDAVSGIDYDTPHRKLRAQRVSAKEPFSLIVSEQNAGAVARCQAGKAWDAVLPALGSVRVRRAFSAGEARALWIRSGKDAGKLTVRDSFAAEPSEFQVLAQGDEVVLRDAGGVFVSSLPRTVLDALTAGCR